MIYGTPSAQRNVSQITRLGEVAADDRFNGGVGGGDPGHRAKQDDLDVHHFHPQREALTVKKDNIMEGVLESDQCKGLFVKQR